MFVGGIQACTTEDSLRKYFHKYGEIADLQIMVDRDLKPRGFGFVTFAQASSIDKVLKTSMHYVDEKLVECKKAVPKDGKKYPFPKITEKILKQKPKYAPIISDEETKLPNSAKKEAKISPSKDIIDTLQKSDF
jgi:RNA recognition motif-containing protein